MASLCLVYHIPGVFQFQKSGDGGSLLRNIEDVVAANNHRRRTGTGAGNPGAADQAAAGSVFGQGVCRVQSDGHGSFSSLLLPLRYAAKEINSNGIHSVIDNQGLSVIQGRTMSDISFT